MKVSLFKLSIGMVILGMVWISFVFIEIEKTNDSILLKQSNSFELKSEFTFTGMGFYKIYMPEFSGEEIFVQILDPQDNVIQEESVQTKMSIGYFDYTQDGIHTIKITNISNNQINLKIEFGKTNSQEMIPGGILVLVGAIVMIIISYFKIKNYKIEQPDENIS